MRKLTVFENVSLDGYFAGPNGEIDWFVAYRNNDYKAESNEFAIDSLNFTDTILFGRVTYDLMASYWPTAKCIEERPNSS